MQNLEDMFQFNQVLLCEQIGLYRGITVNDPIYWSIHAQVLRSPYQYTVYFPWALTEVCTFLCRHSTYIHMCITISKGWKLPESLPLASMHIFTQFKISIVLQAVANLFFVQCVYIYIYIYIYIYSCYIRLLYAVINILCII